MNVSAPNAPATQARVSGMLRELGIPVHRIGYRLLREAIPRFAQDRSQSVTKELYPYLAREFACSGWQAAERSMRIAILSAWERGDPEAWQKYFPGIQKAPCNKQFIATLAEFL